MQTGYVLDTGHRHVRIAAAVVPGWSRDPMFDWIPNDVASMMLYQDPQLLGLVWTSSDPSIVYVDQRGAVQAVSIGTATVTAYAAGMQSQSATFSIVELAAGTVVIPHGDLAVRPPGIVTLRKPHETTALTTGEIVVADDGSLIARLLDVLPAPRGTQRWRAEPVGAEEAFAAGVVAAPAKASCR
jgi:hypothetical protein